MTNGKSEDTSIPQLIGISKRAGRQSEMIRGNMQAYAAIAEAIKARIVSGEWQVGQRLPSIHQLAREFQVGTGSIREAARVLEAEGVLRIEHGRGLFVISAVQPQSDPYTHFRDVGNGSILALLEARRILEPELAALAAERGSEDDLRSVHELAEEMARQVDAGEHFMKFLEPDVQFHRRIADAAQNPVLARMMEGVNDLLLEGRKLTAQTPGMDRRAAQYHLLIADAIDSRNALQARLLMLAHVNDAIDGLIKLHDLDIERDEQPAGPLVTSTVLLEQRALLPRA